MSDQKVSFIIEGCFKSEISGNSSYGSDIGYKFTNSAYLTVTQNKHFSDKTMAHYYETLRIIEAYRNEINEKLGDEKYQEIVNILQSMVSSQSKTPLEYMEQLMSIGANALTCWPAIRTLISMLTGQS